MGNGTTTQQSEGRSDPEAGQVRPHRLTVQGEGAHLVLWSRKVIYQEPKNRHACWESIHTGEVEGWPSGRLREPGASQRTRVRLPAPMFQGTQYHTLTTAGITCTVYTRTPLTSKHTFKYQTKCTEAMCAAKLQFHFPLRRALSGPVTK